MLSGDIVFVYPGYAGTFSGVNPTPTPPSTPPVGNCDNSVGGADGTLYQVNGEWKNECIIFKA